MFAVPPATGTSPCCVFLVRFQRRERLGRIGLHGGAEGMIAQDLTAKVIHRENAHGRLLSCVGSYSAASSFMHPRLK